MDLKWCKLRSGGQGGKVAEQGDNWQTHGNDPRKAKCKTMVKMVGKEGTQPIPKYGSGRKRMLLRTTAASTSPCLFVPPNMETTRNTHSNTTLFLEKNVQV